MIGRRSITVKADFGNHQATIQFNKNLGVCDVIYTLDYKDDTKKREVRAGAKLISDYQGQTAPCASDNGIVEAMELDIIAALEREEIQHQKELARQKAIEEKKNRKAAKRHEKV